MLHHPRRQMKIPSIGILPMVATLLVALLTGCSSLSRRTATPEELLEGEILISEVMGGVEGNNNFEFIELYNTGDFPVDLQGWSLTYRLQTGEDERPVINWSDRTLIPPKGHYLMVREGESVGVGADVYVQQSINLSGGGLELRNQEGEKLDSLGWGKAPSLFIEGEPAPALENGYSLEREPGGQAGGGNDSNNNAVDFRLQKSPSPQNVSSPPVQADSENFMLGLTAREEVAPGTEYTYHLSISNPTDTSQSNIQLEFPIPEGVKILDAPATWVVRNGTYSGEVEELLSGETLAFTLHVQAPWDYRTVEAKNVLAHQPASNLYSFSEVARTSIQGGIIPIGFARQLIGSSTTIEGIATMYTGGFYAGSSGTKLYVEDETGGVQIYVPGGAGELDIPIGALVQATGIMTLYRGAVELVPETPEEVEVVSTESEDTIPKRVSIQQAANDSETLPGMLVQVEGTATRAEEFNYSYEIDLSDDEGHIITLYVDKLTGMNTETIEEGRRYLATGIHEIRDSNLLLNPRQSSDLQEVFPSELVLSLSSPISVPSGERFPLIITATNYTGNPIEDIQISIPGWIYGGELVRTPDHATLSEEATVIPIGDLVSSGDSKNVTVELRQKGSSPYIVLENITATGSNHPSPSIAPDRLIFAGTNVPIWAIQGSLKSSPYKLEQVQTKGVVIGSFPELGGFWIQEHPSDDDPATSAGLFINTGDLVPPVQIGDLVEVYGQIREISGQTQLTIADPADLIILAHNVQLPEPISLDPPVDKEVSAWYFEDREGMLVEVVGPVTAVGPTSKYGEYAVILPGHGVDRVLRGDDTGMLVFVDDGSESVHYDNQELPYVVATGDRLESIIGPLAYTFGQYKIEPITAPKVTPEGITPARTIQPGDFSVMTWNVENLFDILDPHPSDPPRPRKAAYDLSLTKVANTIEVSGAPTVVALQEVEHLGILEDLADHEIIAKYDYAPYLIEGTDGRGIDVGYLIRNDQVEVLDVRQFPAPEGLTSRPPLMVKIQLKEDPVSTPIYILNNHFTSLAGGEEATEPRRAAQAQWNVEVMEQLKLEDPSAEFIVLGDLNSFYDSLPIDLLRNSGLRNVLDELPAQERYNYIYQGVSQTLDHILLTPALKASLDDVVILHVNADYPPPTPKDPSPIRKSDHDPVIAIFSGYP